MVPVVEFCMDRAGEKIRKNFRIISNDQKTLETIVANPVDELCRAPKQRQAFDRKKEIQTNG